MKILITYILDLISISILIVFPGIFLYLQFILFISDTYTTFIIDPFQEIINMILISCTIIIVGVMSYDYIGNKKRRKIVILGYSFLIIVLNWINLDNLKKSDYAVYYQDLGLQSIYMYLDNETNSYKLEYVWPFGKHTILGKYSKEGKIIYLDKDMLKYFNIEKEGYNSELTKLDLNQMKAI